MTIDIIIPAYNAHSTINRTLASIAMQKLAPGDEAHVVIVNDASPDGSYHEIAKYWANLLHIGVVDKKVNAGCGQARQTGTDITDGDCILYIDADDVLGSPFALRVLMDGMKLGYDLVMGMFVEETENGTYINHEANFIWCHGKCYSRKFLKENNIHFNETRGNEDAGFHTVIRSLTQNILYVPQVVYIWEHQSDSTVRKDHKAYAYDYGWRDFIENMSWAIEELRSRNLKDDDVLEILTQILARMYWQNEEALSHFPASEGQNLSALRDFWKRAAKDYADRGLLTDEVLLAGYQKITEENKPPILPTMTYKAFLDRIGEEKTE